MRAMVVPHDATANSINVWLGLTDVDRPPANLKLEVAMGIELTPGLATTSACPEAIWQTAKWWHPFYASTASRTEGVLRGRYCIGHEIQIKEPGSRRSAPRRR